jgi:tRNA(Ile)-lysidine synthase
MGRITTLPHDHVDLATVDARKVDVITGAELAVRRAVREALGDLAAGALVLVACSGGADSLALAAAVAHVAGREGWRAGGVTVDHGLQPGSAERARSVAADLVRIGLDPVEVVHVQVTDDLQGPEGNARRARYAALDAAASRHAAAAVLLGHTRDDQAESVLLGLARGSGARSLAGMAAVAGRYRRPLLATPRETVRAAVPNGFTAWEDPHNSDLAFARARVRRQVLPTLEANLGPGITAALARTADLLREDADALDTWTDRALTESMLEGGSVGLQPQQASFDHGLDVDVLASYPHAIRKRVLRRVAIAAGSPPTDLTAGHVDAMDALVTKWRGQVGVDLPGKLRASRVGGVLGFGPPD